jgi:hypothetical protein
LTFLYVNEDPSLYFWLRSSTDSARHIDQNPMVAFTIDGYTTDLNHTPRRATDSESAQCPQRRADRASRRSVRSEIPFVVAGRVAASEDGTPLVFHGGGYRLLQPPLG